MDDQDLIDRLKALGRHTSPRVSKIARLRPLIEDIEDAFRRGVTQKLVLEALNHGASGFNMPLATFKSALQRIRKERAGCNLHASVGISHDETSAKKEPEAPKAPPSMADYFMPAKARQDK